jgi:hypothetical protein
LIGDAGKGAEGATCRMNKRNGDEVDRKRGLRRIRAKMNLQVSERRLRETKRLIRI